MPVRLYKSPRYEVVSFGTQGTCAVAEFDEHELVIRYAVLQRDADTRFREDLITAIASDAGNPDHLCADLLARTVRL